MLETGEKFDVLKNFFAPAELAELAEGRSSEREIAELTYYWALRYRVGGDRVGARAPEGSAGSRGRMDGPARTPSRGRH
jgi:hypothetical protein